MIEIVRRMTRRALLSARAVDEVELCAARSHLQNVLESLERTLRSMDHNTSEPAPTGTSTEV